jgi:anti-anti-sigma factor
MPTNHDSLLNRPRMTIPSTTEPEDAGARLYAVVDRSGGATMLRPHGEADAYTLRIWQRLLRQASAATRAPGTLIIETADLGFLSCRAFCVLADEADRCRKHGIDLCLVGRQPTVTRLVSAAGLSERLPVYACIDAALSAKAKAQ